MAPATPRRWIVVAALAAALAVFAVVQDRVTAAGARQYASLHRGAASAVTRTVSIDNVMGPAIERSVMQGSLWAGVVLAAGLALTAAFGRTTGRR